MWVPNGVPYILGRYLIPYSLPGALLTYLLPYICFSTYFYIYLYIFRASQVVRQCLKDGCDQKKSLICDLIFCPKKRTVEDKLMVMEAEEVDETINLLYKILYFDWLAEEPISDQLPIILHCVQKFLVVVIEVCPELEASDRMRLGLCSKGLLKQCEDTRYQPLKECLTRTRTLYIQVWCAILCIPFVP